MWEASANTTLNKKVITEQVLPALAHIYFCLYH